jgi:hypothetical protein
MKSLSLPEDMIRLMYFDPYEISTVSNREEVSEKIYAARFSEIQSKSGETIGFKFLQLMNFEQVALNNEQPKVEEREIVLDAQISFKKIN